MLFLIIFTVNIGIGTYFVYYKYMNHDKENFNYQATFDYWSYKVTADVKSINIKNHTYYFFGDMISLEDFELTKNRQKVVQRHWYLLHRIHIKIYKFGDYENIHSVNPWQITTNSATWHFKEKKWWETFNSWFDRKI